MNGSDFPGERRIHMGLAVTDVERSKRFYEILLGAPPTKERPGYAKFEPQDPPLNLALNRVSVPEAPRSPVTHYGIQVKSSTAVARAAQRLAEAGLEVELESETACCYALQDKVWATDPDGNRWEVFVVLDPDVEQYASSPDECCDKIACGCGASADCC